MTTEIGPLTKEIAGIIKGRMARYNISQGEMAQHVGVDQSQLSKMIRGLRHINVDQLEIMCVVSGVPVEEVVADAYEHVVNMGLWPDVPSLVLDGVRVSAPVDDEPSALTGGEEKPTRKSQVKLTAKRGTKK